MSHNAISPWWPFLLGCLSALCGSFGGLLALRLFPDFRSRENKSGEYRHDAHFPTQVNYRLPSVLGPVVTLCGASLFLASAFYIPVLRRPLLVIASVLLAEGVLGWVDDVWKSRGAGLSERVRLGAQGIIFIGVASGLFWSQAPLAQGSLGKLFSVIGAVIFVLIVLSTGFSDGIDGLTGSLTFLSGIGFVGIGIFTGSLLLLIESAILVGVSLAVLLLNMPSNWTRGSSVHRRARAYIGDCGALILGTLVALPPLQTGSTIFLPFICAAIAVEGGSVFLQTGVLTPLYRRWGRLSRFAHAKTFVPHVEYPLPFLATPFHHHFNLLGWKPLTVVRLLWFFQALGITWSGVMLFAPVEDRPALWLFGMAGLVLGVFAIALSSKRMIVRVECRGAQQWLVISRGSLLQIGRWHLEREAFRCELASNTSNAMLSYVAVMHRYDAWAFAATAVLQQDPRLTLELGQRIRPLSIILRPGLSLALITAAYHECMLDSLFASWRRALREVYQEGRLDVLLQEWSMLLHQRGETALAEAVTAYQTTCPDTLVRGSSVLNVPGRTAV